MITKKEIEMLLKERYLWPDEKVIDIDIDKEEGANYPIWALVKCKKSGCVKFYSIYDYGKEYQSIYWGYVLLSDVVTKELKY